MSTEKDLLNQSIDLMATNGKIDGTVSNNLKSYVAAIPYYKGYEILYDMFDAANSTGCTFDSADRKVSTTSPFKLQTLPIALTESILFGAKIVASAVDGVTLKISEDGGTTFYNIDDISIFINLKSATFILQLVGSVVTDISRLYLLYI